MPLFQGSRVPGFCLQPVITEVATSYSVKRLQMDNQWAAPSADPQRRQVSSVYYIFSSSFPKVVL